MIKALQRQVDDLRAKREIALKLLEEERAKLRSEIDCRLLVTRELAIEKAEVQRLLDTARAELAQERARLRAIELERSLRLAKDEWIALRAILNAIIERRYVHRGTPHSQRLLSSLLQKAERALDGAGP